MSDELEELFDRYLNGYLAPDELAQLESWINDHPKNARHFLEWSATHLDTHAVLQANALQDLTEQSDPIQVEPASKAPLSATRRNHGLMLQHLATAACVALLMTAGYFLVQKLQESPVPSRPIAMEVTESRVARIVQRIDCVMQQEKWRVTNVNVFEPGQSVRISEGVVVVEFDSGAQVTLQGPADMEIVSADRGFLRSGKLTAFVPPSAVGFEILTPSSRVIDHGTEFGVSVDEQGNSETHVFDGEIELITTDPKMSNKQDKLTADTKEPQRLTESMAVRVPGDLDKKAEAIPASPEDFVRLPAHETSLASHTGSISDLPSKETLVLWLEASQGVQLDADSRVISWQNLASPPKASSGTESMPSSAAWQVEAESRPHWKANGLADRSAIAFGGYKSHEFLATTPVRTGEDTTAIVVCKFGQTKGGGYSQLLTLGQLVRVILERRKDNTFGSFSWFTGSDSVPEFTNEQLDPSHAIPIDTAHVCAVRYSHLSDTYEIFVDGQLQSEGKTIGSLAADQSYVIGCNQNRRQQFFNGSIAEIAVYDHMLDRQTFDQAMSTLMKKYAIEPGSP